MDKWTRFLISFAASLLLLGGSAFAQGKPAGCDKTRTPEKLEGEVIKVDPNQGKLTVRGPKGETYEFQASRETLQDYKVGDRIQAKLRSSPECKESAS